MKVQKFTLIIAPDPTEEEADKLYGIIDDGTLATIADIPRVKKGRCTTPQLFLLDRNFSTRENSNSRCLNDIGFFIIRHRSNFTAFDTSQNRYRERLLLEVGQIFRE